MSDHGTTIEDSDSIRELFKTTNTSILITFGKFIAECYRIRDTLGTEI